MKPQVALQKDTSKLCDVSFRNWSACIRVWDFSWGKEAMLNWVCVCVETCVCVCVCMGVFGQEVREYTNSDKDCVKRRKRPA